MFAVQEKGCAAQRVVLEVFHETDSADIGEEETMTAADDPVLFHTARGVAVLNKEFLCP